MADGATHVERLVDGFAAPLLQRWRKLDVNHSLSVVLFARVSGGGIERHRDVYRVVLENEAASKAEPATLVSALKRELVAFAASLASVVPPNELRVCRAADGNVPPHQPHPNVLEKTTWTAMSNGQATPSYCLRVVASSRRRATRESYQTKNDG